MRAKQPPRWEPAAGLVMLERQGLWHGHVPGFPQALRLPWCYRELCQTLHPEKQS